MRFITQADLKVRVRDRQLDMILDRDSTILDAAESTAIATIKDALCSRYDTDYIFARTGSARDSAVIRWAVTLMLYYIYERIPDANVPKRIIKNYDDTMMILTDVADAKRSVDLPQKKDENDQPLTKFRAGQTISPRS